MKGVGWYHADDAEAYKDGDTGVLFMTPHFEGYAPDLTVEDIWIVRDAHWQHLLQYDEDPESAELSILERVKRLSNLIGFVDGSPSWKAVLGHMIAVSETERKISLQHYRRYAFLRDSGCVVERWEPDSRYRIYLAGESCEMLIGTAQASGFDTADDAVDAAMKGE